MNRLLLILGLLAAIALTACDTILEYPEGDGFDPTHPHGQVMVRLLADMEFEHLGEFEYDFENPAASTYARAEADHQLRFTVKAFRADDNSTAPQAVATETFYSPIKEEIDEYLNFELLPGEYRLVVWADYIDIDLTDDKYYNTNEFAEISLIGDNGHSGSNPYREAYYGETNLKVNSSEGPTVSATIDLVRPMAKYTFVSTDLAEFLENEVRNNRVSRTEYTPGASRAPALDDYKVRIVYSKYMPTTFNAHTGKPVDSRLGVEYHSAISVLDTDRAQLAFDYVFTNGSETSVCVAMEVVHSDGSVVARMPKFDVPLKREHHTVVTGKFLTTKSGGAIGISPEFEGEFNIFIK